MEAVKVEPWMLRDFSELEREQLKKAIKEHVFHKYSDFIEWVDNKIKHCNADSEPDN